MVATGLRWTLAIELSAAFAAAWALGASPSASAAFAPLIVFALLATLVLITFAIAWPRTSPAAIARECAAYFALFAALQPFERLFMVAAGQSPLLENKPPLIFVHGYLCNRGVWWWMLRKLRWHGIRAHAINLEPPHASIDALADGLHRDIEDFMQVYPGAKPILVTHSMGGLVARAYLKQHGSARVQKLVTLASPHRGTRLAWLGLGQNAREARPGSPWLAALAAGETIDVPLVNVWSTGDNFIAPQTSSHMETGREVALEGLGHLSFLFSWRVLKLLLDELENQ